MSINEVRYLPERGRTNAYPQQHFDEFGPVGAEHTEHQPTDRAPLGRT